MSRISLLQMPKDLGFLDTLKAGPGRSLVYLDVNALEPTVLTEFSQDPGLLRVYGEGAPFNSIYIAFGASTMLFGDKIRTLYNPLAPTKESVSAVKKAFPTEYDILKIAYLGMGYNMQPPKLQEDLALKGFDVSLLDATMIYDDFWREYQGIKRFEHRLRKSHKENGGYIVNARGRPLTIQARDLRDVVNRFTQSSGHDVLMHYILLINRRRLADKLDMRPWCVDEHDCTIWEVADEQVEAVTRVYEECLEELNKILGWGIKIKGQVKVGKSFAIKLQ